ncbi:MAG: hypothetical protein AAF936_10275 [Pseudomonadota bacterium]
METLEFIAVILTFAIVLTWYLHNHWSQSDGRRGLLALRADPIAKNPDAPTKAYRMKSRVAQPLNAKPSHNETLSTKHVNKASSCEKPDAARMRRKFRRQDEARYRVKDRRPKDQDTP